MSNSSTQIKMTGLVHYSTNQQRIVQHNISTAMPPPASAQSSGGNRSESKDDRILSPADLISLDIGAAAVESRVSHSEPALHAGSASRATPAAVATQRVTSSNKKQKLSPFGQALNSLYATELIEPLPAVTYADTVLSAQKAMAQLSANQHGHLTIGITSCDTPTVLCGTLHATDLIAAFIETLNVSSRVLTHARSAVFEYVSLANERITQLEQLKERASARQHEQSIIYKVPHDVETTFSKLTSQSTQPSADLQNALDDIAEFEASLDFEEKALSAATERFEALSGETTPGEDDELAIYQKLLRTRSALLPQYIDEIQAALGKVLLKPISDLFPKLALTPKERLRQSGPEPRQAAPISRTSGPVLDPRMVFPVPIEANDTASDLCRVFSAEVQPVLEVLTTSTLNSHGQFQAATRYSLLAHISRALWPDMQRPCSPAFSTQCSRIAERQGGLHSAFIMEMPMVLREGPINLVHSVINGPASSSRAGLASISRLPADCLVITALETLVAQMQSSARANPSPTATSQAPGVIAILDRAGRLLFTFTWLHAVALLAPSSLKSFPMSESAVPVSTNLGSSQHEQRDLESRCKVAAKLLSLSLREFHNILVGSSGSQIQRTDTTSRPDLPGWWATYILPYQTSTQGHELTPSELPPLPVYFLRNGPVPSLCVVDQTLRPVGAVNLTAAFQALIDYGVQEDCDTLYMRAKRVPQRKPDQFALSNRSTKPHPATAPSNAELIETIDRVPSKPSSQAPKTALTIGKVASTPQPAPSPAETAQTSETTVPPTRSRLADDEAWEAEMAELQRNSMVLNELHTRLSMVLNGDVDEKTGTEWNLAEHKAADDDPFWEIDDEGEDPDLAYARFIAEAESTQADWDPENHDGTGGHGNTYE